MIPFNIPTNIGNEERYLKEVFNQHKYAGNGRFSKRCEELIAQNTQSLSVNLTTSASHSLEISAMLCELQPGDEVIVPSFAFPTTASSFLKHGVSLVFVDIDSATMNISVDAVAQAVTDKTRAIVALHYAGVACDMLALQDIASSNNILLIEDAAQAIFSSYDGAACGTIGEFGCYSFHQSKNIHCGEGGAFLLNKAEYRDQVEMIIEKGTNRNQFYRGEVDKYTWQTVGSSYVLSELNAAFLLAQLEQGQEITNYRISIWNKYHEGLSELAKNERLQCPHIPDKCTHNGHMYWIKTQNKQERDRLMEHLAKHDIRSFFHYQPLHKSPAGKRWGRYSGVDQFTTSGADTLLRLPLYYGFERADEVIDRIHQYYKQV